MRVVCLLPLNVMYTVSRNTAISVYYPLTPKSPVSSHSHISDVQCHTGLTYQFLISDIRALRRSGLSAGVPECQKLKTVG